MNSNNGLQLPSNQGSKYGEIFQFFFRLGLTGFGGPLALVAEMQKELVEHRQWISLSEYRQVFTVIKSMPGPIAFQTALYLGRRRAGRWGGLLAGVSLLLPATVMMIGLAFAYETFQQSQDIMSLMAGFQMGALVLITFALKSLTNGYLGQKRFWGLCLLSFFLLVIDVLPEVALILLAGAWSTFFGTRPPARTSELGFSLGLLIWICLKAGAVVFGTGLAIVPLLENDFVKMTGWMTHQQFMDALAFGQLTPGPVSVTVTFVGFRKDGLVGALAATIAIFFPSGFHQLTWFPRFVGWLSVQKWVEPFVLGATAAITAGIAHSILNLGKGASADQVVVFVVALLASIRWKMSGYVTVLGAGILSWLMFSFFG